MNTDHLPSSLTTIRLQKNRQRRLINGHDWIFSNEIDKASVKGGAIQSGSLVRVIDYKGKFLAIAFYNPSTLVAGRVVGRSDNQRFDIHEIERRLKRALDLREQIFPTPHYRWVFSESDRLPGLIVDRFDKHLAVQITAAGIEWFRSDLVEVLKKVSGAETVAIDDDLDFRLLENLPVVRDASSADVTQWTEAIEDGVHFAVPVAGGQKTGWFYDQRDNRKRVERYCRGKSIADLYCYGGGWGIRAAVAGATESVCVDRSVKAIELVHRNAALNKVEVQTIQADVTEQMRKWEAERKQFDLVVLDPPALIKRRKDHDAGLQSYFQQNRMAVRLTAPGGILVTCSCSHHLSESELVDILEHAGRRAERHVRILEFGGQAADHPVHAAMPETRYLKCIFAAIE